MGKVILFRFLFLLASFFLGVKGFGEEESLNVQVYERPTRNVSIILSDEGFYPKKIAVFQGEKVRFFLTTTESKPGCMILSHHELFLSANKGKITEGEIVFKSPGHYDFYCPSIKHKGTLTVIKKRKKVSRGVASEKKAKVKKEWTPKEYDL